MPNKPCLTTSITIDLVKTPSYVLELLTWLVSLLPELLHFFLLPSLFLARQPKNKIWWLHSAAKQSFGIFHFTLNENPKPFYGLEVHTSLLSSSPISVTSLVASLLFLKCNRQAVHSRSVYLLFPLHGTCFFFIFAWHPPSLPVFFCSNNIS